MTPEKVVWLHDRDSMAKSPAGVNALNRPSWLRGWKWYLGTGAGAHRKPNWPKSRHWELARKQSWKSRPLLQLWYCLTMVTSMILAHRVNARSGSRYPLCASEVTAHCWGVPVCFMLWLHLCRCMGTEPEPLTTSHMVSAALHLESDLHKDIRTASFCDQHFPVTGHRVGESCLRSRRHYMGT